MFYRWLLLIVVLISQAVTAEPLVVRHPGPEASIDPRKSYFVDLLNLSLKKSEDKFGGYVVKQLDPGMYQNRQMRSLNDGLLDVMWTMTSSERETKARAVYIPLMQGLLGYRVFIINDEDADAFESINGIQKIKNLTAIQGHDWPDTEILRFNGFRVDTWSDYMGLFKLVSHRRYRYFPRGIFEAWEEVDKMGYNNLMVEQKHLLVYPTAIYYFVAKENKSLADRLTFGLERAIADGSFQHLLYNHPSHKKAIKQADLTQRSIHFLTNPLLSDRTPLIRKELWFNIRQGFPENAAK